MIPSIKKIQEALAEFGYRGSLLDDANSELHLLKKYINKKELLYPACWCVCGPEECARFSAFAKKINCDFNYKPSWGFVWIAISIPDPYQPKFIFHITRKEPTSSDMLIGFEKIMEKIKEHMNNF